MSLPILAFVACRATYVFIAIGIVNLAAMATGKNVGHLISMLADKNNLLRRAPAQRLGLLKDSRAVESLITALKDNEKSSV